MLLKQIKRSVLVAGVMALALTQPVNAQSASECSARADRAARDSTSVLGGAAAGAVTGGATQAYRKNERYKQVYDDCMRGR
jgi:hypothetical protein